MEQFTVSSCEDVNSWFCTYKLIYTLTQPDKMFFAIEVKFASILSNDTFSILYSPQVCILYTVWHKLCGNVCSKKVPVAPVWRDFTVPPPFPFMWVCFEGGLGGLCIFSFCTTQYHNYVDNSHVIFNSDQQLKCFFPLALPKTKKSVICLNMKTCLKIL